MALIEIIMGEHPDTVDRVDGQAPIQYSVYNEGFRAKINGEAVFEPVAPLRALFAKLKARDNLLGAVLARLGADPGARETEAHNAVGRLLADREAVSKIADCYVKAAEELAQGLGLSAAKPDELADQVLAMNTELTAALSSSQAEVKALTEENAWIRAEVEQERGHKLHAMTAADIAISRSIELEAEVRILKSKLAEADLERMLAEARLWGLASELQHLEVAMREKLRV